MLCGTPQDLNVVLKIIVEEAPLRWWYLTQHKSLLYIPPRDDVYNTTLPFYIPITTSGFCHLGLPIREDWET